MRFLVMFVTAVCVLFLIISPVELLFENFFWTKWQVRIQVMQKQRYNVHLLGKEIYKLSSNIALEKSLPWSHDCNYDMYGCAITSRNLKFRTI